MGGGLPKLILTQLETLPVAPCARGFTCGFAFRTWTYPGRPVGAGVYPVLPYDSAFSARVAPHGRGFTSSLHQGPNLPKGRPAWRGFTRRSLLVRATNVGRPVSAGVYPSDICEKVLDLQLPRGGGGLPVTVTITQLGTVVAPWVRGFAYTSQLQQHFTLGPRVSGGLPAVAKNPQQRYRVAPRGRGFTSPRCCVCCPD